MEIYYKSDFDITDNIGVDLSALDLDVNYYTSGKKVYTVRKRGAVGLYCSVDTADSHQLKVRFAGHGLRPGILYREIRFLSSGLGSIEGLEAAAKRQQVIDSNGEKVRLTLQEEPSGTDSTQGSPDMLEVITQGIRKTEDAINDLTTMMAMIRGYVSTESGNISALLARVGNAEAEIFSLKSRVTDVETKKPAVLPYDSSVDGKTGVIYFGNYAGDMALWVWDDVSGEYVRVGAPIPVHITSVEFGNSIPQITAEGAYDYSASVTPADTTDIYTIGYEIESINADGREESGSMVYLHYFADEQEVVLEFNVSTGNLEVPVGSGYSDILTVTAVAIVDGEVVATAQQETNISIN